MARKREVNIKGVFRRNKRDVDALEPLAAR
jgi:hypothetical protein